MQLRLDHITLGNFGDWKSVEGVTGLYELRDHYAQGYRIYYTITDRTVVLLLAGSTKRDQQRTITQADKYLADYHEGESIVKNPTRRLEHTTNAFLQDLEAAALYLEEALADGDIDLFKIALRNVAEARLGGMTALAEKTGLGRESLYKSLSEDGNPRLNTLTGVLKATGLRLSVTTNG